MKKALLILALAVAGAGSSFADGFITFQFFGDGSTGINGQMIRNSTGQPVNNTYTVGLFAGNVTGNANATPIATTKVFGAGTQADPATGLFQYSGSDVAIPGSTPGQSTVLTLKAWNGTSFASSTIRGESSFTSAPLGGINPTPPPPSLTAPDLSGGTGVGFKGLTVVTVPEPATLALGALGLGALGLIRRRK